MNETLRVLVVVPTYNERDNLPRIVPRVLEQGDVFHILVVDDNSPDGTGGVADALAAEHDRVAVLHRPGKQGLGAAYVAGFTWGLQRGFDVLVEMDADLSHPPDMLPVLLEATGTAEVVVGSRYVGGRIAVVNWPMRRLLISLFGSWYARVITRLPVRDATGGFQRLPAPRPRIRRTRQDPVQRILLPDRTQAEGVAQGIQPAGSPHCVHRARVR